MSQQPNQTDTPENLDLNRQGLHGEFELINKTPEQYLIDTLVTGMPIDLATTDFKAAEKIVANQYAATIHPILKLPRVVGWLMKLEELGMRDGNIKALEVLLDRAFGKVTETIALGVGQFSGTGDGELLDELKRIRNKGV